MFLNDAGLREEAAWQGAGIGLPRFKRAAVKQNTRRAPAWVHFGAGNIFRAFLAAAQQQLLNAGVEKTAIIVAEGYDGEIIGAAYTPYDDLSLLVTLKADGTAEKTVVASVAEALNAERPGPGFARLQEIFAGPGLQMASFTITEKGYALTAANGQPLPPVQADFEQGPAAPQSYMGKVAALCLHRWQNGGAPLALVSMDNCPQNGTLLQGAVLAYAQEWQRRGHAPAGFVQYVANPEALSFPWTMIDKITPRPSPDVQKMLAGLGLRGMDVAVTGKGTYVAPFVNAEETQYLVVEDAFPNGRPALEKAGILFTTRKTVEETEKMKVSTCLNPLHTALAVFGCLLGYTKISYEMQDALLVRLVKQVGYAEGLPVAVNPGVLSPREFLDTVVNTRLPNPFMPDTPQRIATDTSQKLAVRFGQTIRAYLAKDAAALQRLVAVPLVLAGWCRYLMAVDDGGTPFTLSPDPLLPQLAPVFSQIHLGQAAGAEPLLEPILRNTRIFGVDLYEAGLAGRVLAYFSQMAAGPGAVRATLEKELPESAEQER